MSSKTLVQELDAREQAILDHAKETLEREGELEFDGFCAISEGDDNGAYVQGWVWIPFDGVAGLDKEPI